VLAGGAGRRLRALTTTSNGVIVPKQYCSLRRGPSLLTQALIRASSVAPTARTCAVVAAQHRWWWGTLLNALPEDNVFVQPEDRGTGHGILLALLRLEARDPDAIVVMLPADHYIRHEALFAESLRHSADLAARTDDEIYLLGAEPDRNDPELGYIIPADRQHGRPVRVAGFVEKPDEAEIRRLIKLGALWNMFIIAGSVRALLSLYDRSYGESVSRMRAAIGARPAGVDGGALRGTYRYMPSVDFSRHLLEPQATKLQVLRVPPCGWNDLGTPKRVIETLLELQSERTRVDASPATSAAALSLADQYGRISRGRSLCTLP
jgi:mannose-1-phosphate guanylyltransferase